MTNFAKLSAQNLCEEYKAIFLNYKKYGDVVLDVDLKDEPGIKEVILKSKTLENYEKNIKEFWVQNFQIVISKCSDIEKAYNSGIYETNIPIATALPSYSNAVISDDFYGHLCSKKIINTIDETQTVYAETDKFIYKINIYQYNTWSGKIIIKKNRIPKVSIVTD